MRSEIPTHNVTTEGGAGETIDKVGRATEYVLKLRSSIGAQQNRLEHMFANDNNILENTTAAESRIRDTDMASQMVEFTKNSVLSQAGTAMLAQANSQSQNVLSLLR